MRPAFMMPEDSLTSFIRSAARGFNEAGVDDAGRHGRRRRHVPDSAASMRPASMTPEDLDNWLEWKVNYTASMRPASMTPEDHGTRGEAGACPCRFNEAGVDDA